MMLNNVALFFALLILTGLVGCGNILYQENRSIPNSVWAGDNRIQFDVQVKDTLQGYDFYIDLRNDATYGFANIYMFVTTTFPNGKTARDTVECMLADRTGRWLGNGLGDVIDNHILFKQNIRFPKSGTYSFEFEQGMRNRELPAIMDVGISIEEHRKK